MATRVDHNSSNNKNNKIIKVSFSPPLLLLFSFFFLLLILLFSTFLSYHSLILSFSFLLLPPLEPREVIDGNGGASDGVGLGCVVQIDQLGETLQSSLLIINHYYSLIHYLLSILSLSSRYFHYYCIIVLLSITSMINKSVI